MFLGLDTSNYTTSAAVVCGEEILRDERIPLYVPEGRAGLRQSDALFQHWRNLPQLLSEPMRTYGSSLQGICVSAVPRPAEASYMPVFGAGVSAARMLADALAIPLFEASHQEGHIKAAARGTDIDLSRPLLAAHLSGGTTEFLYIDGESYEIAGGTRDISYGQLLDRTGLLLGMDFPAGRALDELAESGSESDSLKAIGPVSVSGAWLNLSGIETQLKRHADRESVQALACTLFARIAESLISALAHLKQERGTDQVLITGGVAASRTLRTLCRGQGYAFGAPSLCSDNAVGVALLKGRPLWQSNR